MQKSDNKIVSLFEKSNPGFQKIVLTDSMSLKRGGCLKNPVLAYETWGKLSKEKDNIIVILTGLSASSHVASSDTNSEPGWWEGMVGKGKAFDTSKYYVICINSLGSCFGSTGPASVNEITGEPYRLTFPELTIDDMAMATKLLFDKLKIKSIYTLIGPSMGGMHSLALIIQNNNFVKNFIAISTARESLPYSIAIRSLQREVIRKDPSWNNGYYSYDNPPLNGVRIARKLGMLSYRSADEWAQRFGRKKSAKTDITQNTFGIENTGFEFEIESYLEHLAIKFQNVFDANSYLYLSRSIDWFDLVNYGTSPNEILGQTGLNNALVLGVESDTLFPVSQQKEIAEYLASGSTKVVYKSLNCIQGHDSFLVDIETFSREIKCFLENI